MLFVLCNGNDIYYKSKLFKKNKDILLSSWTLITHPCLLLSIGVRQSLKLCKPTANRCVSKCCLDFFVSQNTTKIMNQLPHQWAKIFTSKKLETTLKRQILLTIFCQNVFQFPRGTDLDI